VRARKRFGQHFLEDVWVRKVVAAIDPQPGDVFLEIGPGRGALTLPIAARAVRVVAIEVDRELAAHLPTVAPANVRIVLGDFLEVSLESALPPPTEAQRIRVAGNLPYNISSRILFRLLEARAQDAVLFDIRPAVLWLTDRQRARELIRLSHPRFREGLEREWRAGRQAF